MRHKRIGYDLNVMQQSECLVIDKMSGDIFAALFTYTPMDRAIYSMMDPT